MSLTGSKTSNPDRDECRKVGFASRRGIREGPVLGGAVATLDGCNVCDSGRNECRVLSREPAAANVANVANVSAATSLRTQPNVRYSVVMVLRLPKRKIQQLCRSQ